MYLRPRSIFTKFLVEEKINRLDARGRQEVDFKSTGEQIFAVVSSAEPKERERWHALGHTVTHEVIQRLGRIRAKVGDLLVSGDKKFLVQAIDDPAALGQWYIYYCEERFDI